MNMTDKIKHHLSDGILMAYAAGTLPEAFNLMIASHISICDTCRTQAESYDAVGGALISGDQVHEEKVSDDCLAATMALIAKGPKQDAPKRTTKAGVLPGPLQDYVGGDLDQIKWRPIGMGVKQAILPTTKEASARLLLIPAGAAMPDHGHAGIEMTMVLKGAFSDEHDCFSRGDVEFADQDIHHTPVADIREDCICLAVSDAPLKFTSLLPRLAQPFLKI